MRKAWITVAVLAVGVAYWAWPYFGAYSLAKAAEAKDSVAVAERVDFPELRHSVARQVIRAYLRQSGRGQKMGALQRGLAMAVGTSVADPYLAELLSPDALTSLLGEGRLKPVSVDGRTITFDEPLPKLPEGLGRQVFAVIFQSFFDGPTSFVFHVRTDQGAAGGRYGIHMHLNGATWLLSGIDLPGPLLDRIAADIAEREKASKQT